MRAIIKHLDTVALDWSTAPNSGISTKLINTDKATGDRTVLLRSSRREDNPATRRRAHYHHGSEEFLTLGPAFTFDAGLWLPRLSYVYLPPLTIHGTDVRVPDGYLIYLRTEAPGAPVFEPGAVPQMAFTRADSRTANPGVVIEPGPTLHTPTNATSRILRLTPGFTGALNLDESKAHELFMAQGELTTTQGQIFGPESYACLAAGSQIEVAAVHSDSFILISPCRKVG